MNGFSAEDLVNPLAALACNRVRAVDATQAIDGGAHHVNRVARTEALGEHVVHPGDLEHRAHGAAGNDAGTDRGRLHEHFRGTVTRQDLVVQRRTFELNAYHVAARVFHRLLHRRRHFARLAATDADTTGAVADHGQRREAELPAALEHLGHTPDVDELLLEVISPLFVFAVCAHVACPLIRIAGRLHARHPPAP